MLYINTKKPFENFLELYNEYYFVDKSNIIANINTKISTKSKYICITKPRRFGKSSIANMLGAYYTKGVETKDIFDKLNISKNSTYNIHLNRYNVIYITFNKMPDYGSTYNDYIEMIKSNLIKDLKELYPSLKDTEFFTISDMLSNTNEKFIFIFDEWDYIFANNLFIENQNDFLEFLRNFLKDEPYVALAYMTGVLPIKKYSSGSALNMFDEYTMLNDMIYGEYFGFTEKEVMKLCEKQEKISFDEISDWYNGYINEEEDKIYNPRSVVKALQNGKCISYWTNTGAMDEVKDYLAYNILDIREDIVEMVAGEEIDIVITEEYRAGQKTPGTKKEIYAAMIILGFLSYHDGSLRIPNKELMLEFEKAISDESFGYVSEIISSSKQMLKATIEKNEKIVQDILQDIHNSEIPILQYNDENSLSCVLTLAYLSARDRYRIEREEKSGKGYADFSFHPRRKKDPAIIVELKKDEDVNVALKQIIDKDYALKFKKEYNKVLAVAISYNSKKKNHKCIIKEI
ncbi:AAA family ATPase [Clostridium sp.]|uniref:AAA family ATPase n=1 Tax=Clostridium sp. TaxID=1506 RepID=UPI001B744A48|nr:AAA family ATPase [Clostridium sp.]MBP3914655.1 AAA family ATPase [Clostridium sp.]